MSELPSGPLPADLEKSMQEIMHDVGLASLTKNILRKRLEAKYQIEFTSHAAEVDKTVSKLMMTPEIQRELAKIQTEKESVSARRAGTKRSASSDKKPAKEAKKDGKKKEAASKAEKKPEDYPKAALSAYFIFGNENRDKVKEQNPDFKITQVMSEVGNMWKALSDEQKAPYVQKAEQDKKRFESEMEAYLAKGGQKFKRGAKAGKSGKVKRAKDPNAPKRALSAYFFFAGDYRAKHAGVPAKQMMADAGAAWGKLSDEEKKPYEELAAKDRKRYEAERANQGGAKASESDSSSSSDSDSDEN